MGGWGSYLTRRPTVGRVPVHPLLSCRPMARTACEPSTHEISHYLSFYTARPVCAVRGDVAGDAQQEMRCAQVLQPSPTVPLERPSSPTSSLARSRTPSRPDRPGPCVRPRSCARSASLLRARVALEPCLARRARCAAYSLRRDVRFRFRARSLRCTLAPCRRSWSPPSSAFVVSPHPSASRTESSTPLEDPTSS